MGVEDRGVDLAGPLMSAVHQLCVNLGPWVKGPTAVKAEAARVLAVEARVAVHAAVRVHVPDLDVSVAEEVHWGRGAACDAAHHTAILSNLAVGDDLLGGNLEGCHAGVHFLLKTSSLGSLL